MLNIVVVIVLLIGIMFTATLYDIFVSDRSMEEFIVWYLSVTGAIYFSLAFSFITSLVILYRQMSADDIKQIKFQSSRVKLVSTAFALGYTVHTLVFTWAAF